MKMPAVGSSAAKYPVIPAGSYKVRISESEMRKSRAGNEYLYLRFQILEGPYKASSIFSTIIFSSAKSFLRKRGYQTWVSLLNALSMPRCPHESMLIGRELTIDAVVKERNGSTFTEVKRFALPKTALEIVEEAKASTKKAGPDTW